MLHTIKFYSFPFEFTLYLNPKKRIIHEKNLLLTTDFECDDCECTGEITF